MAFAVLFKGAKLCLENCLLVKEGEAVSIIYNIDRRYDAESFAAVARNAGADPLLIDITPLVQKTLVSKLLPALPKNLLSSLKDSDIVVNCTPLEFAWYFAHCKDRKKITDAGARIGDIMEKMIQWSEKVTVEDLAKIHETTKKVDDALVPGKSIRITSQRGTDLSLVIWNKAYGKGKGGRPDFYCSPLRFTQRLKGMRADLPDYGESSNNVEVGTANGKIVIEWYLLGWGFMKNTVELTVKDGRVIDIKGAEEAEWLKKQIQGGSNRDMIAELGVGTSHTIDPELGPCAVLGTAHIAVGENFAMGGQIESDIHIDCFIRNPTIEVEGRKIMENGKLVL